MVLCGICTRYSSVSRRLLEAKQEVESVGDISNISAREPKEAIISIHAEVCLSSGVALTFHRPQGNVERL